MQSITSVANPLYGVSTLTSSASSTVRRSRVAIPVNQEGVYGNRTSDSRYVAQCTLGSNQDGIISANTYWEFDITPTWWDQTLNPVNQQQFDNHDSVLTPTFDQSVSALISRMKISLPQGLVIEEIPMYNQLCNIVDLHSIDPVKKSQNVVSLSSYSKNIFRERGENQYIDGAYYKSPTFACSLRHGKTTRVQVPLTCSSFMKSVRYIPLFLLRNGLQFEVEFEDPYKAFVLEQSRPSHQWKHSNIPNGATYYANLGTSQNSCIKANFAFGPGTLSPTGELNVRAAIADVADEYVANHYSWPKHFSSNDLPAVRIQLGTAPGMMPTAPNLDPPVAANTALQYTKNFMYLAEDVAAPILELRNNTARKYYNMLDTYQLAAHSDSLAFCVPIVLKRDGIPVHRFFTSMSLANDYLSWTNASTISSNDADNPWAPVLVPLPTGHGGTFPYVGATTDDNTYLRYAPYHSVLFNASTNVLTAGNGNFAWCARDLTDPGNLIGQGRVQLTQAGISRSLPHTVGAVPHTGMYIALGGFLTAAVPSPGTQLMLAFPTYKYNHFAATDSSNAVGDIPIFPMPTGMTAVEMGAFQTDFFNSNYTMDIGLEDAFILNLLNASSNPAADRAIAYVPGTRLSSGSIYDPAIKDLQHVINYGKHYMNWNYSIRNIRMVSDMCQPSSDVFSEYSRAFQSRIGIPYTLTRIITVDRTFDVGTSGAQQFVIPISARSLKSILVTFDDPYFRNFSRNTLGAMYTPFLSSFMRRGLVTLTLTIGGATKPEYTLRFDRNGGVEHQIETGSAFGVPFISGINSQLTKDALAPTRSYFVASNFDMPISSTMTRWASRVAPPASLNNNSITPKHLGIDYVDASKFVVAIPLARTDQYGFASGLDSTMSGSLVLTATFELDGAPTQTGENFDPGQQWGRQIHMTVRGDVDAVLTFQNDLSTTRW